MTCVPRLRASGGKATTAPAKPREVLEPPPSPRKPKPKPKPAPNTVAKPTPAPVAVAAVPAAAPAPAPAKRPERRPAPVPQPSVPTLQVVAGATPQVLADKLNRSPADIVKILFMAGEMVTATTSLTDDAIALVAAEFGLEPEIVGLADRAEGRGARRRGGRRGRSS